MVGEYYQFDSGGQDILVQELETGLYAGLPEDKRPVKKTAIMRVSPEKLGKHTNLLHGSSSCQDECNDVSRKEAYSCVIRGESVAAVKLWMEAMHDDKPGDNFDFSIANVWEATHFGHKYLSSRKEGDELRFDGGHPDGALKPAKNLSLLGPWYERWYSHNYDARSGTLREGTLVQLLAPAYWFDCARVFAEITGELAYLIQNDPEKAYPTYNDAYMRSVPYRILKQLKGIAGSLRGNIANQVAVNVPEYLQPYCSDSSCRAVLSFAQADSLYRTTCFPPRFPAARRKCIRELLDGLDGFKLEMTELPADSDAGSKADENGWAARLCDDCRSYDHGTNITEEVLSRVKKIRNKFQGLCLDCMHKSKTGAGHDADYWVHANLKTYAKGCRISHGQSTWYFSFFGRREVMEEFQKKLKAVEQGAHGRRQGVAH